MDPLDQSQPMDEVPAGVDPIQHEQRRWGEEAQKECLEAKLDSDSAVPAWADVGHGETADTQSPSSTDVGGTRPACAMRNQGNAPAGAASGVCSQHNKPSEPAQQDRSPSGERSPESLQAASAKPNPESMESVESMAIETILNMDAAIRCEQVALYWQQLLSEQHTLH